MGQFLIIWMHPKCNKKYHSETEKEGDLTVKEENMLEVEI